MKDRPILFSAPMVRAILAGTKTQTRRAVKRIPWLPGANPEFSQARPFENTGEWRIAGGEEMTTGFRCPYGQPGDRLWVRETWGCKVADRPGVPGGRKPQAGDPIQYGANEADAWQWRVPGSLPWRPSIHMPRWASRITLEVTGVRVERLQDISHGGADAEGCPGVRSLDPELGLKVSPLEQFQGLWESINGHGSWAANPWVWVVEFSRMTPKEGGRV